jgi:hypothetical protein
MSSSRISRTDGIKGYAEQVMKGSGALAPPEEDPSDVARAIVNVVKVRHYQGEARGEGPRRRPSPLR